MANIGLRNARYNEIDYTTKKYKAIVDEKVPILGRMIDAKLSEDRSEASLFADDGLAEYESTFAGAKLNLTLDNVDDETYSHIKGCQINKEGEITENQDDSAPELGYGHIITKMVNGAKQYKVEFLARIKINSITADAKTKGESIEFNTVSIEAKVMPLIEEINGMKIGDWKKSQTFNTLTEAQTYLDKLLNPKTEIEQEETKLETGE